MEIKVLKNKQNLTLTQAKIAVIDIGSNSIRMLIYDYFRSSLVPFFTEKGAMIFFDCNFAITLPFVTL